MIDPHLLRDPAVIVMLDRNHRPTEETHFSYGERTTVIRCDQCGDRWPCQIRLQVNEAIKDLRKKKP